ncbi:MAG: NAD-dependent DNA ligase LigA [Lachnospiraceae bacterium]|nr:NAD-dependent DNA ligase LigA [Lachnospiraceae bacterium]
MDKKRERIKELTRLLNDASRAYYQESREIMSNYEYDALYDELTALEKETGIVMAGSPTVRVGYEILSELPKERHAAPMLSLDKTKDVEALRTWLNGHEALLSWKMDGLTVVLTYEGGTLSKAVTRGNGEIGEVITPNARTFINIPMQIAFKGQLILRGEAVISYSNFKRINSEIGEEAGKYKNPRNLCSGSVRQLSSEITAKRQVQFHAFSLVSAEGMEFEFVHQQFEWLAAQGFDVVDYMPVRPETIGEAVESFSRRIPSMDIPSDGLVLTLDDIAYGISLGRTAKFPRNSIAFKWADETAQTRLRYIEWSASRTGLINPVAVFDPVELEGTTVSRASVHNVSIVESLKLGQGDRLMVYKANMIIPQIAENLTRSATCQVPDACPVCGSRTEIRMQNDAKSLYCTNPECPAKKIKAYALFVSRDAMNMDGISEATLEKLTDIGMVHDYTDLYHFDRYKDTIINLEGMGQKSYDNLIASVDKSRQTTIARLVYALGIEGIGPSTARLICNHFDQEPEEIFAASEEELLSIDGIGPVTAKAFAAYFADGKNLDTARRLLDELQLHKEEAAMAEGIAGKTFVITGSVNYYPNRKALQAEIESLGGKVAGSVSSRTDYLINNDSASSSSKNKKARELGIPILTEEDYRKLAGLGQEQA